MNEVDKKLYELFSKKELKFGCLVSNTGGDYEGYILRYINHTPYGTCNLIDEDGRELDYDETCFEILGHEPQLHDVFRVAKEKGVDMFMGSESLLFSPDIKKIYVPYNPTLPLLSQSDETKQSIIYLLTK